MKRFCEACQEGAHAEGALERGVVTWPSQLKRM